MEGALTLFSEFPDTLPHFSSIVLALQLSIEQQVGGARPWKGAELGGGANYVDQLMDKVHKIGGEKIADNVLFFAYLKSEQLENAEDILKV